MINKSRSIRKSFSQDCPIKKMYSMKLHQNNKSNLVYSNNKTNTTITKLLVQLWQVSEIGHFYALESRLIGLSYSESQQKEI